MAVIELLRVHCAPNRREEFLTRDADVWTPALVAHDGFLSKEVFVSRDDPSLVTLIIRWASMEQWKSFPIEELERIEAKFTDIQLSCDCETYDCPEELTTTCPEIALADVRSVRRDGIRLNRHVEAEKQGSTVAGL